MVVVPPVDGAIVIPITKGSGVFKGVTGKLSVGAESRPINTYQLKFP